MPNPPVHINLACQVAERLENDTLNEHIGYFLLGSTSPDIRVITRMKREHYHFTTLDFKDIGAGVRGLFENHPDLQKSHDYSGQMQAFMAGYITHLIADESWIVNMFRPYFGNSEVFADRALGMVLDRAMQLEMDRQCWDIVNPLRPKLELSTDHIQLEFIEPDTLNDWSQWIIASLERGFSWERLRFMARRISGGDESHPAHEFANEFVDDSSNGLDRLFSYVPEQNIDNYRKSTVDSLAEAVEDYLP